MPPIAAETQSRRTVGIVDLSEGDSLIGSAGRTFQCKQKASTGADQGEKSVKYDIMVKQPARVGTPQFADKDLKQFGCRAVLGQQKRLFSQFGPINHIARSECMGLGESNDDTFTPEQQRPVAPPWSGFGDEGDVNGGAGEVGDETVSGSVDKLRIDIREAVLMVGESRPEITGGERCVHTNGQSTALATRAVLDTHRHSVCLIHDALGRTEKFLTFNCWSRAAIGALEESHAHRVFKTSQAATER